MNNSLLKKAFTEAQLNSEHTVKHSFSPEFEAKMNSIIRSQSRSYTFINTTAKRVACVILAALISLFGAACGVKQVREPIIREVKRIIVNISELFTGTKAEEISELLPTEVTKIIAFDHSDTAEAEYVIADADKIKSFVTLMTETAWRTTDNEITADELNAYWSFEFYSADGSISARLDMCRNIFSQGAAVIVYSDDESNLFVINNKTYDELLCFTNKRYYLHDSSNEMPGEELCNSAAEIFFADMANDDIKSIRKEIRAAHYAVEEFLLENVTMLKSENSVYWNYLESGEIFIDPIADYERSFKVNTTVTEALKKAITTVNDTKAEALLKKALKIWNDAVKAHDLDGLFTAHEYIHDIDYFCVNYPTHYVYDINVDFQGIDDYFGHIDSLAR